MIVWIFWMEVDYCSVWVRDWALSGICIETSIFLIYFSCVFTVFAYSIDFYMAVSWCNVIDCHFRLCSHIFELEIVCFSCTFMK